MCRSRYTRVFYVSISKVVIWMQFSAFRYKIQTLSCVIRFVNLKMLKTKKRLDACLSSLQCALSLGNWNSLSRSSRNLGAIQETLVLWGLKPSLWYGKATWSQENSWNFIWRKVSICLGFLWDIFPIFFLFSCKASKKVILLFRTGEWIKIFPDTYKKMAWIKRWFLWILIFWGKKRKKKTRPKPNLVKFPVNVLKNERYRLQKNCRPEVPTFGVLS